MPDVKIADKSHLPARETAFALIKEMAHSTPELPFWHSPHALEVGLETIVFDATSASLFISDGSLIISDGYIFAPGSQQFERRKFIVKWPVFDYAAGGDDFYKQLRALGLPVMHLNELYAETNKSMTALLATRAGVGYPPNVNTSHSSIAETMAEIKSWGNTDLVAKPIYGSQGKGVVMFNSQEIGYFLHENGGEQVMIEKRIVPPDLVIDGVVHDWNLRIVMVEGELVGWYARAGASDGPVNISLNAFLLTQNDLRKYMPKIVNQLLLDVPIFTAKLARTLPNGTIGLDAILDRETGELILIEANCGTVVCTSYTEYPLISSTVSQAERSLAACGLFNGYLKAAKNRNKVSPTAKTELKKTTLTDFEQICRLLRHSHALASSGKRLESFKLIDSCFEKIQNIQNDYQKGILLIELAGVVCLAGYSDLDDLISDQMITINQDEQIPARDTREADHRNYEWASVYGCLSSARINMIEAPLVSIAAIVAARTIEPAHNELGIYEKATIGIINSRAMPTPGLGLFLDHKKFQKIRHEAVEFAKKLGRAVRQDYEQLIKEYSALLLLLAGSSYLNPIGFNLHKLAYGLPDSALSQNLRAIAHLDDNNLAS